MSDRVEKGERPAARRRATIASGHGVSASPTTAPLSSICSLIASRRSAARCRGGGGARRRCSARRPPRTSPRRAPWFTSSAPRRRAQAVAAGASPARARASARRRRTKMRLFAAICSGDAVARTAAPSPAASGRHCSSAAEQRPSRTRSEATRSNACSICAARRWSAGARRTPSGRGTRRRAARSRRRGRLVTPARARGHRVCWRTPLEASSLAKECQAH